MCKFNRTHTPPNRRQLLLGAWVCTFTVTHKPSAFAQAEEQIQQPTTTTKQAFMARAFEMRDKAIELGDQAYGAVIVQNGKIIGQSWSRVVLDQDPTAHAELMTIRDAAKRTRSRHLRGTVLYSSSRPCPMCEAAAYWAGISSMIYGRDGKNGGAPKLCG